MRAVDADLHRREPDPPVARPDDEDAVRSELRGLHAATEFPVLFGGIVRGENLLLTGFAGTRSQILRNLTISSRLGLGGRVIVEQRPAAVEDYFGSPHISHDYDREVGGEGIESLLAVPIVVAGRTRAALYGGLRSVGQIGGVLADHVIRSARALAREFEIRDEVDRRVALVLDNRAAAIEAPIPTAVSEAITESHLRLHELAQQSADPVLVDELTRVEERLRGLGGAPPPTDVRLTRREHQVLSYVALGCRNAEIARRLGLRTETVKSYMRNLLGKLDADSRHEAVTHARRLGLLP